MSVHGQLSSISLEAYTTMRENSGYRNNMKLGIRIAIIKSYYGTK